MDTEEIFVNDGAKSDTGNIQELLGQDCVIGVSDPVYPVYIDSNVMAGRAGTKAQDGRWSNILYMPCSVENGFVPSPPQGQHIDVVYLCFPNNPTGAVIDREDLERWVRFALENDVLILYDAAYHAYIRDANIPRSIYEIADARRCAIEFHSYSKTAGFTGVRCGYTIVPKELTAVTHQGERIHLGPLWNRRQCTKLAPVTYHNVLPRPSIRKKAGSRCRQPSIITWTMLVGCWTCCAVSTSSATAVKMLHISGCVRPTACLRGNSSKRCFGGQVWFVRLV